MCQDFWHSGQDNRNQHSRAPPQSVRNQEQPTLKLCSYPTPRPTLHHACPIPCTDGGDQLRGGRHFGFYCHDVEVHEVVESQVKHTVIWGGGEEKKTMYNLNMRAEFTVLGNRKSARLLRAFTVKTKTQCQFYIELRKNVYNFFGTPLSKGWGGLHFPPLEAGLSCLFFFFF